MTEYVWLSIGSNLSNPRYQVDSAIRELINIPNTTFIACSSYYRSKPLGIKNQPDFLNVVVQLSTSLSPEELLNSIHLIELHHGRIRTNNKFGPRTLDLDIILFGNHIIRTNHLIIPHYDMHNREFVLYPLFELSPQLLLPDGSKLSDLIDKIAPNGIDFWTN